MLVILGACGIHLCIGSVYAWSVLVNPIVEQTHWSLTEVTFTFSIAILFLGLSAAFLGGRVGKWGARTSAVFSAILFGSGLVGSSLAIRLDNLTLLYFAYGVIGGMGLGIGYISPIATLMRWFPNHKGFAGGCAVMAFGYAAMIASSFIQGLLDSYSLENTFMYMAAIYTPIMLVSSLCLIPPNKNDVAVTKDTIHDISRSWKPNRAVRTVEFWAIWTIFFINIACGIALLSILAPMGEMLGMSVAVASGFVGTVGLVNGGGRIAFAAISDKIGRENTYLSFFIIELFAFATLVGVSDIRTFEIAVCFIIACYGGGFSCMPAFLADVFGVKYLSAIHGRILTAWGFAGIFGPMMLTKLYELYGNYDSVLAIFYGLFIVNILILTYLVIRRKTLKLPMSMKKYLN